MGSIHWNGPNKGWDVDNEYHWAFKEYEIDEETAARAVTAERERDRRRLEKIIADAIASVGASEHDVVTSRLQLLEEQETDTFSMVV
jgi:hypothetical protein